MSDEGFYTDADIEMAELTAAGNSAARGICYLCDDYVKADGAAWQLPCDWDETTHQQCRDTQAAEKAEDDRFKAEMEAEIASYQSDKRRRARGF